MSGLRLALSLVLSMAGTWAGEAAVLPDKGNPDYLYCEDFESGREQTGALPPFSITGRQGVRAGAGWKSGFGYSNVLVENNGLPPYPEVRFPRHDGVLFAQYMVQVPANYYIGRGDHGYYLFDAAKGKGGKDGGMAVVDHATDHRPWLDPEWDPNGFSVLRGSGYHRILRSFEGHEPGRRGQWHSYQVMIVPSQKDPAVGRMKVWVDGVLSNFCKHDTISSFDTFWISNYWHSLEYVPKDTVSNVFESFTAPPHPAFEILLDNLIISKQFVEFGPNRAQVERLRITGLKPDALTLRFDSTVPARSIAVQWGEEGADWRKHAVTAAGTVEAPGYFHAVDLAGMKPGKRYALVAIVEDAKGRRLESSPLVVAARAEAYPDLIPGKAAAVDATGAAGAWKGEIFLGRDFSGAPAMVRTFESLSSVSWPGVDAELGLDTTQALSIRYSKRARFAGGPHVFRFAAYDGLRITLDGEVLHDKVRRTQGHYSNTGMLRRDIVAGEHDLVVEHTVWREKDWEQGASKQVAVRITPGPGADPPQCLAQAIYSTRFHKPEEPAYCGRWSTEVEATVEFGETPAYGQSAKGDGRYPFIKLGKLEVGKNYHWRATAVDGLGNRTVTPDATFICGDTLAPRKILCSLKRSSDTAVELSFGAPGEDGRHGQAASYDIRWSDRPLTVATWETATRLTNPPAPQTSGKGELIILEGLPTGKTWHVAVRAIDQAGQAGLLSNIVSDPPGPEVMDCDGDGFGVGSLKGPDPDDYDARVPAR